MNQNKTKAAGEVTKDQAPVCHWDGVNIDLENWMGQLPECLTRVPLIHISIPGSHNSFSYSLTPDCGVSPDSPPFVQNLGKWCKPLARYFILNWSKGQKMDIEKQLKAGIRYFDVRLVLKDGEIVVAHGLYGGQIQYFLEQINEFLESHPKEVVIMDFQHFYEFTPPDHERMFSMLLHIFGDKICHRVRRMRENTLELLWAQKHQILIVYRHQVTAFNNVFWPSGTWVTAWPNKINVSELIECLNKGLSCRKEGIGYVTQGILTPTAKYVALHTFGSLKALASQSNKKIISWLETKNNGVNGINVVICDFVEKYDFAERVILLNYKEYNGYQSDCVSDFNQNQGVKY